MEFSDIVSIFQTRSRVIVVGSSVILLTAYVIYRYFRSLPSETDEKCENERAFRSTVLKILYLKTANKIISLERCTSTKIRISKKTIEMFDQPVNFDKLGTLRISGREKDVEDAIRKLAKITCELHVKRDLVHKSHPSRIIGKAGRSIALLRRQSGAYIRIDKLPELKYTPDPIRKTFNDVLYIVGTEEEIREACKSIDNIINCIKLESIYQTNTENATPNENIKNEENGKNPAIPDSLQKPLALNNTLNKFLNISKKYKIIDILQAKKDDYIEIWITSLTNSNLFWIQPYSVENDFSDITISSELKQMDYVNLAVDEMVAAPFNDFSYLRAIITKIEGDKCEVFFVDFGDVKIIDISEIRGVNDIQKNLPLLAVPCCLKDISPINGLEWSKEAVECFIEITNAGVEIPSKIWVHNNSYPLVVDLITIDNNINVSDYLVNKEYAKRIRKTISEPYIIQPPKMKCEKKRSKTRKYLPNNY